MANGAALAASPVGERPGAGEVSVDEVRVDGDDPLVDAHTLVEPIRYRHGPR
jgi:hypothetical protein